MALRVPGGAQISRGEIDGYTEFVKIYGAKGLAWIKVNDVAKGREGLQSPVVKNLHDAALAEILKRTGAVDGDLIFFGADQKQVVANALGALVNRHCARCVFGKAMTSRKDSAPVSSITKRSSPIAMPPCGGAPYCSASSR